MVPLGTQKESLLVANYLRNKGCKVEYEMSNKKLGKALDKANKENIPYVIIIGENEVKNNQYKIKDMSSGEERIESYLFK
ncbi:His/Gly/Thr/Pro-type tRNA ligase C-terminal domain-containing protein [Cytobacillus firmus]|nr:His/Gly/Thr/Pro-type tRNA ligase C-terminal domain-containing protein [Cytobacillus firmus]